MWKKDKNTRKLAEEDQSSKWKFSKGKQNARNQRIPPIH